MMLVCVSFVSFFFLPFTKNVISFKNRFVKFTYKKFLYFLINLFIFLLWCLSNLIQLCDKFFLPGEFSC